MVASSNVSTPRSWTLGVALIRVLAFMLPGTLVGALAVKQHQAITVPVATAMGGPFLDVDGDDDWFATPAPDLFAPPEAWVRASAVLREAPPAFQRPSLLPVPSANVSSNFGRRTDPFGRGNAFHSGIDFAAPTGTPVLASAGGTVKESRYSTDYGNLVTIDHGQGLVTLYAHNSKVHVRKGDVVRAGEEIAKVGSTGRSTGPHLHFEVRHNGVRKDPRDYLAGI